MFKCLSCGVDAQHSVVCRICARDYRRSPSKKKRALSVLYELHRGEPCFHCGKPLTDEEMILDHFPYSKGSRPDLYFDERDLKPSCSTCNISNNPNRKDPKEYLEEHGYF